MRASGAIHGTGKRGGKKEEGRGAGRGSSKAGRGKREEGGDNKRCAAKAKWTQKSGRAAKYIVAAMFGGSRSEQRAAVNGVNNGKTLGTNKLRNL